MRHNNNVLAMEMRADPKWFLQNKIMELFPFRKSSTVYDDVYSELQFIRMLEK